MENLESLPVWVIAVVVILKVVLEPLFAYLRAQLEAQKRKSEPPGRHTRAPSSSKLRAVTPEQLELHELRKELEARDREERRKLAEAAEHNAATMETLAEVVGRLETRQERLEAGLGEVNAKLDRLLTLRLPRHDAPADHTHTQGNA